MKRVGYKYYIIITVILMAKIASAQDLHFSQFPLTPTFINPGTAGTFTGDFRGTLNFKEQFSSFNNAFKTYRASYDMPVIKDRRYKKTGAGIDIFQDVAGDSKTKITSVNLSVSQTIQLKSYADLSLGIAMGYSQYSANYLDLMWDSQFNGLDYDETLPTLESFYARSEGYFDFSAGLFYRYFDYYGFPYEIGLSFSHLTTPSIDLTGNLDELPMKITLHGKKEIELQNDRWGVIPMIFIAKQRQAYEINGGVLMRCDVGLHSKYTGYYKNTTIYFGATMRLGDAIIPQFYLNLKEKYTLGLSYDVNISQLVTASQYRGGLEVSLSMSGFFTEKYRVISPVTF